MGDWRLQGQEKYLKNASLMYSKYKKYSKTWDHDHCEFCGQKFSEVGSDLHEGYCTEDHYRWICPTCFNDFKARFNWTVNNTSSPK